MPMPRIIVAADTTITLDGKILEKPTDRAQAKAMLAALAGRQHVVHTCVSLLIVPPTGADGSGRSDEPRIVHFDESTRVDLDPFPCALLGGSAESFLDAYLDYSDEAMDKSAACAYQGMTAILVSAIHGCYYSSLGFPIRRFVLELEKLAQQGVFLS